MVKLAADAIFSFSLAPMRITIILGLIYLVLALAEILYVISYFITNKADLLTPGWPSLMFASLLGNAIILISLGVFGYYIGYIFQQIKNRPLYIIKSIKSRSPENPEAQP
jgi:dolichol-phosphate mannosyltransferase